MISRRFTIYFSWDRWKEVGVELGKLENRYPTLFEFRRHVWPNYEWCNNSSEFSQGIIGFLDHVILLDFKYFINFINKETNKTVSLLQRYSESHTQKLTDEILENTDTLIIISLDHFITNQHAEISEIYAVQKFLEKSNACVIICPHHDIGAEESEVSREVEYRHHGDGLVPSQQRIGGFAISLLNAMGYPIKNQYGLNPAKSIENDSPAPLILYPDMDGNKILQGVETFNLHPHLPHLFLPDELRDTVRILAKQYINPTAPPHPYTNEGNKYFNSLLWIPPDDLKKGSIYICDATLWSSAFGGVNSLEKFWKNLAHLN